MPKLRSINSENSLSGKTAVLRVDSDIDLVNEKIVDDTRLAASIDTINHIIKLGGKINIIGHLGRPELNQKSEILNHKSLTLEPIAKWFASKFKGLVEPIEIQGFKAWKITENINLLENIRYFEEEEEDPTEGPGLKFSEKLAKLGDIYVNDAFAVSHRTHASIVGIAKLLPSYAGLHLMQEVKVLSKILDDPARPLVVLIGGAKIETKLPLVEKMHKVADYVLVGGEIADQTRVLIKIQHEKLKSKKSAVLVSESTENGEDITTKSVNNFGQILGLARTIVWNGPVGKIGSPVSEKGTRELANIIIHTNAYKVVGGGDTLAYLKTINMLKKFDFVSTGGGAMLEFLSGHELPGIKVLEK